MGLSGMHMPGINGEILPFVPFQQYCAEINIVFKVVPVNINPEVTTARIVGIKKSRYIIKNPVEGRTTVGEDPPGVVHLPWTVQGDLDRLDHEIIKFVDLLIVQQVAVGDQTSFFVDDTQVPELFGQVADRIESQEWFATIPGDG